MMPFISWIRQKKEIIRNLDITKPLPPLLSRVSLTSFLFVWIMIWLVVGGLVINLKKTTLEHGVKEDCNDYRAYLDYLLTGSSGILKGFTALIESEVEIKPETLKRYVDKINQDSSQIFSLEVGLRVSHQNLDIFYPLIQKIYPDFKIKSFGYSSGRKWYASPRNLAYIPLVFIAPARPGTQDVIGLDLYSVDFLKEAANKATELNSQVASRPFELVEGNRAFVVFNPMKNYVSRVLRSFLDYGDGHVTDMVIDIGELFKNAPIKPKTGEIITVFHSDYHAFDETGVLYQVLGNEISTLEKIFFPIYSYEQSLQSFNDQFRIQVIHQMSWSDIKDYRIVILLLLAILSSMWLLVSLKKIQQKCLVHAEHEQTLWRLANYDSLTTLANRSLIRSRLQQLVAKSHRHGAKFAVIYLDLDGFKKVNDEFGHDCGDNLLKHVASCLLQVFRIEDTVARIGGDEFIVLIENLDNDGELKSICSKINEALVNCSFLDGKALHIRFSIGYAIYPDDGCSVDALINSADKRMYQDKKSNSGSDL